MNRSAAVLFGVIASAGVAVHLTHALATDGESPAVQDWLYGALFLITAASCAWRAARRREDRLAWVLASLGVATWLAAEVYYRATEPDPAVLYPPVSRALLLLGFSLAATTIALLARRRVRNVEPRLLLDGLIGGLAVAAVAAIPLFGGGEGVAGAQPGPPALFLLADLAILAFVVVVTGLTGWRPGTFWALVAGGIVVNTVGNCALVAESAAGNFQRGGPVDSLFVASAITLGVAAFFPVTRAAVVLPSRRGLVWPAAFGLVAVCVLTVSGLVALSPVAVGLATATLVVLVARMSLAFVDNGRLLARAQHEAITDALTGLGNRRALARDFEAPEDGSDPPPRTLVLFDLDGFKAYNDAFGHPAGDTLLAMLSGRLGRAVAPHAAYRVGGDEFCVLVLLDRLRATPVIEAGAAALVERGEAFSITASHGAVGMPEEARSAELALQLADRRMYAHKDRRRTSPSEQTRAALQQLLDERSPAASAKHRELADLVFLLGERQGLRQPDLDHLVRAAELHDIGRAALPAGIAVPSDGTQALIAERILMAAPALAPVARIVRSTHERYDGGGHPDGLAGQDIPVSSRIIAAAQAFLEQPGIGGLARHAGTRLDPFVVDTLHALASELRLAELAAGDSRRVLADRAREVRHRLPSSESLGVGQG